MSDDPIQELQRGIDNTFTGPAAGLKEVFEVWATIVSRSYSRHIDSGKLRSGRIVALCGFSLWPG